MHKIKKVLVAMSGGVDSSVAAALLLEQGYEVEGCTMQIWQDELDERGECDPGGCCSITAVDDARRVSYKLGIRHHVLGFKDIFRSAVIEPFVQSYRDGETPNPCIACNRVVKFGELLRRAETLGFDAIATGHYSRIQYNQATGRYELYKANTQKDQSYALYNLTQPQLARLLLPLGDMEKQTVRKKAAELGLSVAAKPDSQEICFVKDNDYAGFIERFSGPSKPGDFVDLQGNVLGKHKGIIHYTVGQRKGLGMAFGAPRFVVRVDTEKNQVVLGGPDDVFSDRLIASDLNFIALEQLHETLRVEAKIRYQAKPAPCTVIPDGADRCQVVFDTPQRAITPGQAVVFYNGNVVVGGGTIQK